MLQHDLEKVKKVKKLYCLNIFFANFKNCLMNFVNKSAQKGVVMQFALLMQNLPFLLKNTE